MCKEGGANLVHFLMGKALTTHDPQYENIRDWSYRDITHLPQAEQKLWRLACQEELDMLCKRKVFELVDHPRDQKVCYDRFSSPVGTENRDGSEVEEILTAVHREFGGCAHHCVGKPKRRDQDRASPRRRGRARSGTAEG